MTPSQTPTTMPTPRDALRAQPAGASSPRRLRMIALCWCSCLLVIFAFTGRLAWAHKSATCDEPLHLMGAWLQTHYHDFRCNPEDPPFWKYYVALGTDPGDLKLKFSNFTEMEYPIDVLYRTPENSNVDQLLAAGRARMVLIGVLLGALIGWWAWRLAGPVAAMVAVAAFCLDPNFLAHAPLIKDDVPITLLFLGLMAAVWYLGERATLVRWLVVALLLGMAITTKFSGIGAIPMLGIALTLRAVSPANWRVLRWVATTRWQRFAAAVAMGTAALLFAYFFLWACYDFRFVAGPQPAQRLRLTTASTLWAHHRVVIDHGIPEIISPGEMHQWMQDWRPDRFIRTMYFIDRHHWMPEAWLSGFIYTAATSLLRPSFLLGDIDIKGWWYYFPVAMLVKTPLATLLGLFAALVFVIAWAARRGMAVIRRLAASHYWPLAITLVAPVFYMAVAMHGGLNIGLRHVFPVYPFLFIFLGVVAAHVCRWRPRISGLVLALLFVGLAAETASAFPNYIPFFNVAARTWPGELNLLSDSNIDWGQELLDLVDWQAAHPDRQIFLSYFGSPDPQYYGLRYVKLVGAFNSSKGMTEPANLRPVFVISACGLQGTYVNPPDRVLYDQFKHKKPLEVLGGCLYIFDAASR